MQDPRLIEYLPSMLKTINWSLTVFNCHWILDILSQNLATMSFYASRQGIRTAKLLSMAQRVNNRRGARFKEKPRYKPMSNFSRLHNKRSAEFEG